MASRPIAIDDDTSIHGELPSGKRLHNYGKSPCLMGKLTINCHFIQSVATPSQRTLW